MNFPLSSHYYPTTWSLPQPTRPFPGSPMDPVSPLPPRHPSVEIPSRDGGFSMTQILQEDFGRSAVSHAKVSRSWLTDPCVPRSEGKVTPGHVSRSSWSPGKVSLATTWSPGRPSLATKRYLDDVPIRRMEETPQKRRRSSADTCDSLSPRPESLPGCVSSPGACSPTSSMRSSSLGSTATGSCPASPAASGSTEKPADGQTDGLPAWVFCTRYSDRPAAGPRLKKPKRRPKETDEKRPRTTFTSEQLSSLRVEFDSSRYLTEERRRRLSGELGLTESQVKIWFQNKRAKQKKSNGNKSNLAQQLMAQGLYNHSTVDDDEDDVTAMYSS